MTLFEFAVTYAVCWWLVLFMVLPHQADAPANPGLGHAPSAPARPQLRKKLKWATMLAFVPAFALYLIVNEAKAEETIYHVGSKCRPLATHQPRADVAAKDGYGTGDKKLAPATIEGDRNRYVPEKYSMSLWAPANKYTHLPGQQQDLSDSFIHSGEVSVSKDGNTTLNGQAIAPQETYPEGCEE